MDDFKDIYLGKILKKWVALYPLPEYGRARLLWVASHLSAQQRPLFRQATQNQYLNLRDHGTPDWTYKLFPWATLSPFKVPM